MSGRALAAAAMLLVLIEIIRRLGASAICYVDLRYDPTYAILNPDANIARECTDRHLLFPFGL